MTTIETITQAIARRRVLRFVYKGEQRSAEPYILGYDDKDRLVLSAVQVSGGSGAGFRSFRVENLSDVAIGDRHFSGRHPDYNPLDPYIERVLARV